MLHRQLRLPESPAPAAPASLQPDSGHPAHASHNPPSQNVHEFEDREFANVSKEDLKLDEDKGSKKREKALKVGWG